MSWSPLTQHHAFDRPAHDVAQEDVTFLSSGDFTRWNRDAFAHFYESTAILRRQHGDGETDRIRDLDGPDNVRALVSRGDGDEDISRFAGRVAAH